MKRRIALDIETSTDGERCDPGCPHTEPIRLHWCTPFGPLHGGLRHPACIEAERKAQGALIQADYGGFARALRDQAPGDYDELRVAAEAAARFGCCVIDDVDPTTVLALLEERDALMDRIERARVAFENESGEEGWRVAKAMLAILNGGE